MRKSIENCENLNDPFMVTYQNFNYKNSSLSSFNTINGEGKNYIPIDLNCVIFSKNMTELKEKLEVILDKKKIVFNLSKNNNYICTKNECKFELKIKKVSGLERGYVVFVRTNTNCLLNENSNSERLRYMIIGILLKKYGMP